MTRYETPPDAVTSVLFGPRGRLTEFARELRCPLGTVFSWKQKGSIPPWRRPAVLEAARRMALDLPPEALAYLATAA